MLVPKRVKHRKEHRGNMKGRAKGGTEVAFGEYRSASDGTGLGYPTVKSKQHVLP